MYAAEGEYGCGLKLTRYLHGMEHAAETACCCTCEAPKGAAAPKCSRKLTRSLWKKP